MFRAMGDWASVGPLLAVLTPLVGVPLTAITFYLRGLREQCAGRAAALLTRVERLEEATDMMSRRIADVERDCTTREEWVRENMLARRERRLLTNAVVRLKTKVQSVNGGGLGARLERTVRATLETAQRLERVTDALAAAAGPPGELAKD